MSGTREEKQAELEAAYRNLYESYPLDKREDFYKMIAKVGKDDIRIWYHPDSRIQEKISRLRSYCDGNLTLSSQDAGCLLEEIVYLVFSSLWGIKSIKSYQSPGPQHDLLVFGGDFWRIIFSRCGLPQEKFGILIEAKAEKSKPVKEAYFSRLSCIIKDNFPNQVGLGIFFSISGASGFPKSGVRKRQRCIRDARFRQVITYARYKIPIIVFDLDDIVAIQEPGGLIEQIEAKVRDIEELSGFKNEVIADDVIETDLPNHLSCLINSP
jgi:hypothetical protein